MASIQSVVDLLTKYINLLHRRNVHTEGDQTVTGNKTFTEKLFLAPKEDYSQSYIYGTENTANLKIQNRTVDAITDPLGYPARAKLELEAIDNTGQGRFTLTAQSKYDTTNQRYYQYDLVGTSDGSLTWTGGGNPSTGHIEIVDSSYFLSSTSRIGYIRYSSGLQICWGSNVVATASSRTFTFAKPFIETPVPICCYGDIFNYGGQNLALSAYDKSALVVDLSENVYPVRINWGAFGRWK